MVSAQLLPHSVVGIDDLSNISEKQIQTRSNYVTADLWSRCSNVHACTVLYTTDSLVVLSLFRCCTEMPETPESCPMLMIPHRIIEMRSKICEPVILGWNSDFNPFISAKNSAKKPLFWLLSAWSDSFRPTVTNRTDGSQFFSFWLNLFDLHRLWSDKEFLDNIWRITCGYPGATTWYLVEVS